ncbi:MAG: MFS transporter [Candidatus Moranbacteria bacterium]|nr:MFS transporter [Candidatus Moranbacteria bacterium]
MISFMFGFADAFLVYVLSSYFKEVFGTENVSFFYLVSFSIVLIALFYLHDLVRRVGKTMLLFLLFIVAIMTNATLILFDPSWFTIVVLMIHLVVSNLIWVNLDIILESFSEDGKSGRIRGLFLTIVNSGWLLAPILSTRILSQSGYAGLFFAGLVMYSCILVVALLGLRRVNQRFKEKITPGQILKKIRRKKDILHIYSIAFVIEFFYAVMIVYTPLYLLELGFGWDDIGIMFTAMLVPFVLIQYPLGVLADKRLGEKEMLIFFLVIMIVSTAWLPFIVSGGLWMWSFALFMTRVGAAGMDILRDSYFYKRVSSQDVDIIAFFRTARPVANISAASVVGVSLLFIPLSAVFFVAAGVLFLGLVPAFLLVDNASEREMNGFIAQGEG